MCVCTLLWGAAAPRHLGFAGHLISPIVWVLLGAWLLCLSVWQHRMTELCIIFHSPSAMAGAAHCVWAAKTLPHPLPPSPFLTHVQAAEQLACTWWEKGKGEGDGALYVLFAQDSLFRIGTPPMLIVCVLYSGGLLPPGIWALQDIWSYILFGYYGCLTVVFISLTK